MFSNFMKNKRIQTAFTVNFEQRIMPAERIRLLSSNLPYNQSLGGVHTKFDNDPIKIIHVI